jgi:hypothetical protein
MNYVELREGLRQLSLASKTAQMRVFVTMPDPERPGKTMQAEVDRVSVAAYHDPGETNHSVWIHLTEPEKIG